MNRKIEYMSKNNLFTHINAKLPNNLYLNYLGLLSKIDHHLQYFQMLLLPEVQTFQRRLEHFCHFLLNHETFDYVK